MLRTPVFAAVLALSACGGEPPVTVIGTVSSSVSTDEPMIVAVNGAVREVSLEDRRFSMVGVPSGDLVLAFETRDAHGAITIQDVTAGERIEVRIAVEAVRLEIRIVRRDQLYPEDDDVDSDSDRRNRHARDFDADNEDYGGLVTFDDDL